MWRSVQFRNRICSGALRVRGRGCWRFDRCSHGNSVTFIASLCSFLAYKWPSILVFVFQVQPVMLHVSPGPARYQLKQKWGAREDEDRPSLNFVPLSGQQPGPVGLGKRERRRGMLEQGRLTMVMMNSKLGYFRSGFLCVTHFIELLRQFSRLSCNCSNERHRTSIGDAVPLNLCWRKSTNFGSAHRE